MTETEMNPGKGKTFRVRIDAEWFRNPDVLKDAKELEIMSQPKWNRYNKWYWKILYYLTFKQFFIPKVSYRIKLK